jgi:uncharacterized protein (DUF2249 family)
MTDFVELDVRPALRAGGEPFAQIMETVNGLGPNQGLRLLATFKPTPLFHVLGAQGFTHEEKELGGGEWQVDFSRAGPATNASPPVNADDRGEWPEPIQEMDNRELDPPEPMVRILAATEQMANGEVLAALLCREPIFLLPELAKRGHGWRGGFEPDGKTYRVLIRIGAAKGATKGAVVGAVA